MRPRKVEMDAMESGDEENARGAIRRDERHEEAFKRGNKRIQRTNQTNQKVDQAREKN